MGYFCSLAVCLGSLCRLTGRATVEGDLSTRRGLLTYVSCQRLLLLTLVPTALLLVQRLTYLSFFFAFLREMLAEGISWPWLIAVCCVRLPWQCLVFVGSYNWLVSAHAQLGDAKSVMSTIEDMARKGYPAGNPPPPPPPPSSQL